MTVFDLRDQIVTGVKPFNEKANYEASIFALSGGRPQPATSDNGRVSEEWWKLFECCWQEKPEQRISIDEVLGRVTGLSQPMGSQEGCMEDTRAVQGSCVIAG